MWCWPQEFGQPLRWMRIGSSQSISLSRCATISRSRAFVSVMARLQNSLPVQETAPLWNSETSHTKPASRMRGLRLCQLRRRRCSGRCSSAGWWCAGCPRSTCRRCRPRRTSGPRSGGPVMTETPIQNLPSCFCGWTPRWSCCTRADRIGQRDGGLGRPAEPLDQLLAELLRAPVGHQELQAGVVAALAVAVVAEDLGDARCRRPAPAPASRTCPAAARSAAAC